MVLEKALESPLDSKEIKPINPKGNQPWILIGRTDDEAEAPILWPPDAKKWHIGKDLEVGKERKQKEKRAAEDEMIGYITDSVDINWGWVKDREEPGVLQSMGSQGVGHDLATGQQLETLPLFASGLGDRLNCLSGLRKMHDIK